MPKSTHNFELYRYQILPIDRKQSVLFENEELSVEELIKRKNEFFIEAFENLCSETNSSHYNKDIIFGKIAPKVKPISENDNVYVFVMAKQKHMTRETDSFTSQNIENWPKIHLIVLNNEYEQIIAIEHRANAFSSTKNATTKLTNKLNAILEGKNLAVHISPIYEKRSFWEYIEGKRVKRVEFNLITPNMANISQAISDDLKALAKHSNAARTELALNASDNNILHITPDNEQIIDLVDYASQGGGEIKVQISGYKRAVNINKGIKTVSIDNMVIVGNGNNIQDMINSVVSKDA